MNKINVIGTTGSDKSTFSKELAEALNYPYVQMDAQHMKHIQFIRLTSPQEAKVFLRKVHA